MTARQNKAKQIYRMQKKSFESCSRLCNIFSRVFVWNLSPGGNKCRAWALKQKKTKSQWGCWNVYKSKICRSANMKINSWLHGNFSKKKNNPISCFINYGHCAREFSLLLLCNKIIQISDKEKAFSQIDNFLVLSDRLESFNAIKLIIVGAFSFRALPPQKLGLWNKAKLIIMQIIFLCT